MRRALPPPGPLTKDVALFLDLDGTLAPIAQVPSGVRPDASRNALISRVRAFLGGKIAIVSGRPISDVDRILGGSVAAIAGIHGLERRAASGRIFTAPAHQGLENARAAFERLANIENGLIVEDKGLSIALHYRSVPRAQDEIRALARQLAEETGLSLQEGKMVVELRTPGFDKGDAIAAFMAEAPFSGARPIFAGDDLTDEHGFAIVERTGGEGVLVGAARRTHASRGLADVDAVHAWLETAA
ncbi:MAG TPA: trehalose-phosphatase [Rhizomicrobium sp.]|nr:trehalose-phosphatase [Rhizomicrobium sp.]